MKGKRKFIEDAINSGLEFGLLSSTDILRELTAEVLAHHLPVVLKAKLIQASLDAGTMDANLIVKTVGVSALSEHCPIPLLWGSVRQAAARVVAGGPNATSETPVAASAASAASQAAKTTDSSASNAKAGSDVAAKTPENVRKGSQRKPNRSARPSINAGATSRQAARVSKAPAPISDNFDVDVETRVGPTSSSDFDIIDESEILNEETNPGLRKN